MVALSLKINIGNVVKTMQFEPSTMVYDACRMIRERVPEAQMGQRKSVVGLSVVLPCQDHPGLAPGISPDSLSSLVPVPVWVFPAGTEQWGGGGSKVQVLLPG